MRLTRRRHNPAREIETVTDEDDRQLQRWVNEFLEIVSVTILVTSIRPIP